MRQHDGLQRGNPGAATSRHAAILLAHRHSDGHKMSVPVEPYVESLCRPELIEGRVKVQIRAGRNATDKIPVSEQSRNVDEHVRLLRAVLELRVGQAHRFTRARPQQGCVALKLKVLGNLSKILGVQRIDQTRTWGAE